MPRAADATWLSTRRIRFVAIVTCAVGIFAWLAAIGLSRQNQTPWHVTLGGDFPAFYIAGKIARSSPGHLYDFALQNRMYHALAPLEDPAAALPYVYPPVIAGLFSLFSWLDYCAAVTAWGIITLALYLAGLILLCFACREIPKSVRWTGLLLSLAFEPLLIETLHGGQISAIGFFAFGCAIALDRRGFRFASGLALGLLAYKPTLLVILVPLLLIRRNWRMLAGMAITGAAGLIAGLGLAGLAATDEFFLRMLGYLHASAAGDGFRIWKFVDLSAFLKMLFHRADFPAWPICLLAAAIFWRVYRREESRDAFPWAATLLATLTLNCYVAIYDTILAVPAAWLICDSHWKNGQPSRNLRLWLIAMFVIPWFTQLFARFAGLQLETLVLIAGLVLFRGGASQAETLPAPASDDKSASSDSRSSASVTAAA